MMSTEQIEVTDQQIQKALDTLGIVLGVEEDTTIQKSEETTEVTTQTIEKSEKEKESEEENKDEDEEEFEKAFTELKKSYPKSFEKKMCDSSIQKSETTEINKPAAVEENELIKGLSGKIDSISILLKNQIKVNDNLQKSLETANLKIEELGSQSNGRKSITSKRQGDYIEKAFGGEEISADKVQYSLSRDKAKIDATLYELSGFEKGHVDEFWKDACLLFNTSGELTPNVLSKLSKEHKIQIVQ